MTSSPNLIPMIVEDQSISTACLALGEELLHHSVSCETVYDKVVRRYCNMCRIVDLSYDIVQSFHNLMIPNNAFYVNTSKFIVT